MTIQNSSTPLTQESLIAMEDNNLSHVRISETVILNTQVDTDASITGCGLFNKTAPTPANVMNQPDIVNHITILLLLDSSIYRYSTTDYAKSLSSKDRK